MKQLQNAKRTRSSRKKRGRAKRSPLSRAAGHSSHRQQWITGPTLRGMLNISAPTLWRWRSKDSFPPAKRINGRLYFLQHEIETWLEEQQDAS
jgi:predicted DNA-binding transcriptional regulator AlpA